MENNLWHRWLIVAQSLASLYLAHTQLLSDLCLLAVSKEISTSRSPKRHSSETVWDTTGGGPNGWHKYNYRRWRYRLALAEDYCRPLPLILFGIAAPRPLDFSRINRKDDSNHIPSFSFLPDTKEKYLLSCLLLNVFGVVGSQKLIMERQHCLSASVLMISGDIRSHTFPLSSTKDSSKGLYSSVPSVFPAATIGALLTISSSWVV